MRERDTKILLPYKSNIFIIGKTVVHLFANSSKKVSKKKSDIYLPFIYLLAEELFRKNQK